MVTGAPNRRDQRGATYHLFTLSFRVLNASGTVSRMDGVVDRLVEPDVVTSVVNIGTPGRTFVAGNVQFVVASSARHRRDNLDHTRFQHLGEE